MVDDPNRFQGGCAYSGGRFVPLAEAAVPLTDWGFIRGDATYDVVSVDDGAFFRLDDHLDRFQAGLAAWRLTCPVSRGELIGLLERCVALSGLRDAYVSMTVTRGRNLKGTRDPRDCENALFLYAVPYVWILPPEKRAAGVSLELVDVERVSPRSVDPRVKNHQWGDMMRGVFAAYDAGSEFPLLHAGDGTVTEGPGFNFFALVDGEWLTPATGVLEGITRKTVLELITSRGSDVLETSVTVEALDRATEMLITSTAGGVMPVGRLNGSIVGPGPEGTALVDAYWSLRKEAIHRHPIDYAEPYLK